MTENINSDLDSLQALFKETAKARKKSIQECLHEAGVSKSTFYGSSEYDAETTDKLEAWIIDGGAIDTEATESKPRAKRDPDENVTEAIVTKTFRLVHAEHKGTIEMKEGDTITSDHFSNLAEMLDSGLYPIERK